MLLGSRAAWKCHSRALGKPDSSAVSSEEKLKRRCKDPSAEGERRFFKSKSVLGFFVWAKSCLWKVRAK